MYPNTTDKTFLMKILYADTDHMSQRTFIDVLKRNDVWSAKYAMAAPAIGNALKNEHFDIVVCGVEFIGEVKKAVQEKIEILVLGNLESKTEIDNLLKNGIDHFMKYPFCGASFQRIVSTISQKEEEVQVNDALPDFEYLDRLTKGRMTLKLDLMEIFVEVVMEELINIKKAIPNNNFEAIGKSAHRMKSNARMMGLQTIMQLLDLIEDHSKNNPSEEFFDTVKDTSDMLMQSVGFVKKEIAKYKSVEAK